MVIAGIIFACISLFCSGFAVGMMVSMLIDNWPDKSSKK